MKTYLYFLFLVVGFCSCSEDSDGSESWIHDLHENEDHESISHPCSVKDLNCIRHFFVQHSHCKVAHGRVPDPFYLKQIVMPLANSNMTFIMNDVESRGLNGKITSFYVNKKTDNLVIAAEVRHPTFYSPNTVLRYHRKGKEPIALSDAFFIGYDSVTYTATIPNYNKLQLSDAEIFTYVDDSDPVYAFGPNVMKSHDRDVQASFNKLVSNLPENAKEGFVTVGPVFMSKFIQYTICDFGLHLA